MEKKKVEIASRTLSCSLTQMVDLLCSGRAKKYLKGLFGDDFVTEEWELDWLFYGYGLFSNWYIGDDDSSLAELRKYYKEPRNLSGAGVVAGDGYVRTTSDFDRNSRLHFIGTSRNRCRKRFPSYGFKHENPTVDASNVDQGTSVIHIDMVADQFYDILHKHCNRVQAVSCDEAFLDVTDRVDEDAKHTTT
ncbi:hypothetical protein IFM89_034289 [Coptis chinensis]|uniref:Uncharacterized protein n=1 Tax=Coptis chinensis TaxID=261450 RepID=A0A835M2E5_9MAGN|nr:hypothetical protein IFM89_034289 [Coptis chinensis]